MTRTRSTEQIRAIVTILLIAAAGLVGAGYVLVHERAPVPFQNTYTLKVVLTSANGVVPGLGQPVNVAGVQVGSVTGAGLDDGNALVTLQLHRSQVPHVYANADATLEPITPLGDVEIDLDPGRAPATPLPAGATLGVGHTQSPVPLSDLLASLDGDTRDYLTGLIGALSEGTADRGPDIRRIMLALGPTTSQVHQLTAALASRRTELAQLVHNLGQVTLAASRDRQLASVVQAGDETLHALAAQQTPLSQAVQELPTALQTTNATLSTAATFADKLQPTLTGLQPAINQLPATLDALRPFATTTASVLASEIRPLVTSAQPTVRQLGIATTQLHSLTPFMTGSLQVLNYFLNELAYNPGGKDQGFLFWLPWFAHNGASAFSLADGNGGIARAAVYVNCSEISDAAGDLAPLFAALLGTADLCKSGS